MHKNFTLNVQRLASQSEDQCDIPNSGNIDINLKLKNETDKTIKVILYATYAIDVFIDQNSNVMIEQTF